MIPRIVYVHDGDEGFVAVLYSATDFHRVVTMLDRLYRENIDEGGELPVSEVRDEIHLMFTSGQIGDYDIAEDTYMISLGG